MTNDELDTMARFAVALSYHAETPEQMRAILTLEYPDATDGEVQFALLQALNRTTAPDRTASP